MILLLECKVDSNTLIEEIIEWRVNAYLFKLYPDVDNRLNKITVECKCHDYHTHLSEVTVENHKITEITFPKEDFYPEQLKMLQYLESFSAIDLGVRKIHWDNPSIHWMPENEEERLAINSYSRNIHYPKNNRKVTLNWLQGTLMHRKMLGHLTEPLSFCRIALNHYHQHSYIQAFLHFYLMIEGVFGKGNTNKKIAIGAFMDSPNLIHAIDTVLESINNPAHKKHKEWFENYTFLNPSVQEDPVRKMVNIFFDERGKLAHYSGLNSERKRNNFEETKYQSLAAVSMMVCLFASVKLRFDPFRGK